MMRYNDGCLVEDFPVRNPFLSKDSIQKTKFILLTMLTFTVFLAFPIKAPRLSAQSNSTKYQDIPTQKIQEVIPQYTLGDVMGNQMAHDAAIEEAIAIRKTTNDMTSEIAFYTPIEEDAIHHLQTEDAYVEPTVTASSYAYTPSSGGCLTPTNGVYYGPSGKETYYNLDMSVIVQVAHNNGIEGEYWIREDGCKMLGSYIMCACNRDVHPYGTLVETSLGTGISLDTGGFAANNPTQIDIAVAW